MSTASLTITVIAVVIVAVLAWKAFGADEDFARLRRRWRDRRTQ